MCDDGADCIGLSGYEAYGSYCAAQCEGEDPDDCPGQPYDAQAQCALTDNEYNFWCILVCTDAVQCPPDQECINVGSASVCL